jgi:hypothetical protein
VRDLIDRLETTFDALRSAKMSNIDESAIKRMVATVEPGFLQSHHSSRKSLDSRV